MASTRRLAAILAADVAGYSRLMGEAEEGTHERLRVHLRQLVDPKIEEHHGRVVKNTGDGFLAEFQSVVDAARCAIEVQRWMVEREPEVPEDRRIRFRIGVNLGDVIVEDHDIFGDGVNVAARLEGLAEPGGICISRVVRDQIRDKLPYQFDDMGEQSVKNIARPVRAYALRPEGLAALSPPVLRASRRRWAIVGTAAVAALVIVCLAWSFWPTPTPFPRAAKPADQATGSATPVPTAPSATPISPPLGAPRLSIVVLPFANLSNDPEQQYFADGITEDLTTDLSRIAEMFVISRNSAFTYRNKSVDTKQIGRELGVLYLLEGSVQRSGHQVRVTVQLIDAETNAHLWADRFDHDAGDLFALQNEVTSRIAIALNRELLGREAARPTDNPDALDYILRARAVGTKPLSRENHAEGIRLYEQALALDPRSVAAQSGLAGILAGRVPDEMTDSAADDLRRAAELVGQALASSRTTWARISLRAKLLRAQGRPEEAIPEYEMVITLNRNAAGAYVRLGWCKFFTGFIEESVPLYEQGIRLSPRDSNVGIWYDWVGRVHLLQSRTGEAIRWLEKARSANPAHPNIHAWLASAYGLNGETDRATRELAEARKLSSDERYSSISR